MKKWLLLLCCFALSVSGCSSLSRLNQAGTETETDTNIEADTDTTDSSEEETDEETSDMDEAFENWINNYIVEFCQQSYSTTHSYFVDPEAYGIDLEECDYTLGSFIPTNEDKQFVSDVLRELSQFDTEELSTTNRQILEQLQWEYGMTARSYSDEYTYLGQIWSTMSGLQTNLVTSFSEYCLYSEADIEPLLRLIEDIPNYIDQAMEYTQKQAELGLLQVDIDGVIEDCQEVLSNQANSPVLTELESEVDGLRLDESTANDCKAQIKDALNTYFFPAFQTIINGLQALQDQNHDFTGLASKENGKEFYRLLVEYYSGMEDIDFDDIYTQLENARGEISAEFSELMKQSSRSVSKGLYDLSTSFKSIEDILPFLEENYSKAFPTVEPMEYQLQPLAAEQSSKGVLAYILVPPIDYTGPYQIRYNAVDYSDDPEDFDLFDTLAHEGVPGHMYQAQYKKENFTSIGQYFLDSYGMQEGYANYAAMKAAEWLGLDEISLRAHQLNELSSNYLVLMMDLSINAFGMDKSEFAEEFGEGFDNLYNTLAQNPAVFFSYYYGMYEIYQMEEKAKEKLGNKYDDIEFNNALLQAGNVKFSIVQENIDSWMNSK